MTELAPDRSYRALLSVPTLGRVLVGMQIARIGQAMVGVTIVLFTLSTYRSAALAGAVTFAGIFPGLLVSPIAGALLDRHGRTRLVVLDYLVALGSLALIGVLSLAGLLPAWLLVLIAALSSLTTPLSSTGLRSLFPLLVPSHLWERVNAVDSNGYVLATVIGPPLAAGLVSVLGGATVLVLIGSVFGIAALVLAGLDDPATETISSGSLWRDAWLGLRYTWNNRTLRALGISISIWNLGGGMTTIAVPLIVLDRLHLDGAVVGAVFALQGVFGVAAAFAWGRVDSRGRERRMLVGPMFLSGIAFALLLAPGGLLPIAASMAFLGLLNGPADIALFTLRQRQTDPAWMGRAFAVSMAFNFVGFPIGSAAAGSIAGWSLDAAIALGVVTCLIAGSLALRMIPSSRAAG